MRNNKRKKSYRTGENRKGCKAGGKSCALTLPSATNRFGNGRKTNNSQRGTEAHAFVMFLTPDSNLDGLRRRRRARLAFVSAGAFLRNFTLPLPPIITGRKGRQRFRITRATPQDGRRGRSFAKDARAAPNPMLRRFHPKNR